MTIEQLSGCDAAQLEVMSDEELLAHFAKYFLVTRPEYAPRVQRVAQAIASINPQMSKGIELAKKAGIDIDLLQYLTLNKRKK